MNSIDPISTARELATHANDIEHLQEDMDKMVREMQEIKLAVQAIQKTLSEAHGGWRMFLGIGGAFAMIGAALGWVLEKVIK
jgi:drug/metabolite transporter superfamily protein YnfA